METSKCNKVAITEKINKKKKPLTPQNPCHCVHNTELNLKYQRVCMSRLFHTMSPLQVDSPIPSINIFI